MTFPYYWRKLVRSRSDVGTLALWILVVVVIVLAVAYLTGRTNGRTSGMSETTAAADSAYRAGRAEGDVVIAELLLRQEELALESQRLASIGTTARAQAVQSRRQADGLVAAARSAVADLSVTREELAARFDSAVVVLTQAADSALTAADSLERAFALERDRALTALAAVAVLEAQLVQADSLIAGLKTDLAAASRPRWTDYVYVGPGVTTDGRPMIGAGVQASALVRAVVRRRI